MLTSFVPEFTATRQVGLGLVFLGVFFSLLGTMLFFDRALIGMGNLCFLTGFTAMSGPMATLKFFGLAGDAWMDRWRKRWRGLVTFMLGIATVLCTRYTRIGVACEIFGFVNLFGALFPVALAFLRRLPVIGPVLNLPILSTVADRIAGKNTESMV